VPAAEMSRVVAVVAPRSGGRTSHAAAAKGQRLSAPGGKEFAIGLPSFGGAMRSAGVSRCKAEVIPQPTKPVEQRKPETAQDSDDEVHVLCPECRLPLGDLGYVCNEEEEGILLHAECKAQIVLKDAKRKEDARLKKDAALKKKRREQYDLGWKVERVPGNAGPACQLGCSGLPHGLCGLVWNGDSKTVSLVPTMEQAASVNLEYLSLALQVRMKEGREPMFSLDPKEAPPNTPSDKLNQWQVKRFEPQWLAGTSVGEVMFQADYHLKELSMGEYSQPVVGMKSCFDFTDEEGLDKEWNAREWFVVKKAEIRLTEDNIMQPHVKMGVEARETFKGEKGLEDVPLTRPNHPLVKYADAFTHNFDLIAERKSVVYHLRELAKASVVAKFLVESEARLEDRWCALASAGSPVSHKEIPQLWNEQVRAQIQVADGQILSSAEGENVHMRTHGVYGGVEMGLDRLGRVTPGRVPAAKVTAARAPTLTARMIAARGTVAEYPVLAPGAPKGVDLNMDQFNLSAPLEVTAEAPGAAWGSKDFLGSAFWASLPGLEQEDRKLLEEVFNPRLSDRRDEGERFVPPSASVEYVSALRALVKEEATLRQDRQERFCSEDFAMGSPGPLFPSSWAAWGAQRKVPAAAAPGRLHARPDYKAEAFKLLKNAVPVFDDSCEDGMRFRIYQVGSIEVRTTQELDGAEVVGAVFSSRAATQAPKTEEAWGVVAKVDRIVKVSEYVEAPRRYYIVLETNLGDMIVTEKLANGSVCWVENPEDLEYRNSLAKVVRAVDCSCLKISAQDMKSFQAEEENRSGKVTRCACKRYAHAVYLRALPAREKSWAALSEQEVSAAKQLGVRSAAGWDEAGAQVWQSAWGSLSDSQREAAEALGFTKALWSGAAQSLGAVWEKSWAALKEAERKAAKVLGITGPAAWDGAALDQPCSAWQKSWVQLTEEERQAVKALGMPEADAWDERFWAQGGAWEARWGQLSEEEQRAAKLLGISGASVWDGAFGDRSKRGQGLAGVWEKSWAKLTAEEQRAARQLGINGAGAWDRSKSKSSVEKGWAVLTQDEQEAKMELWFKQHFQGMGQQL